MQEGNLHLQDSTEDRKKKSSGKRSVDKKDKRLSDVGYFRVISVKKDKDSKINLSKKYETIPLSSGSSSIMHIFSGEKKEDRYRRLRMVQYKQLLQIDLKLGEKALIYHTDRQESLQIEFKEQEIQLWRWGLEHLLTDFRMQSWSRQDRGELLIDMSKMIVHILQIRLNEINQYIEMLQTKSSKRSSEEIRKIEGITDSYYQSPEKLLENNTEFFEKRKRLEHFDRICHSANLKFRQLLPELNSKAYPEREAIIHQICRRYAQLLDEKQLSMDHEFTATATWSQFCHGYYERVKQELVLYAEFMRFVDDEREREGRLFRRWCNLVKSTYNRTLPVKASLDSNGFHSSSSINDLSKDNSSNTFNSTSSEKMNGGEKRAIEGNAIYMAQPKAIHKFIRYFAINIISSYYAIPPHLESALIALTDNVVYRNIHEVTFYSTIPNMMKSDRHWRRQCRLGRYIDPIQYAVPAKYLGRKEEENESLRVHNQTNSTSTDQTSKSLVDQINHHRHSLHSLEPIEYVSPTPTPGHVNSPPEEFENWNENNLAMSNERYSEFISKTRTIKSPQNKTLSQFQSYDLIEIAENVENPENPENVEGDQEIEESTTNDVKRKASDQIDIEDVETKLESILGKETETMTTTTLGSTNHNPESSSQGGAANSTVDSHQEFKVGEITPPAKSRSNRSPSIEKNEIRKKSGGSKRKSGSSRFKKDPYCDSLLDAATLRSLDGRLEHLLASDLILTNNNQETKTSRSHIPYAYAARIMGLIEIAVTPREIIVCVLMAMIWLTRLANELSGKHEILGADSVFPILVHVLINANISHIHPILAYVTTYSNLESFGEAEYYMTCITAAVEFIDGLQIPVEIQNQLDPEVLNQEECGGSDGLETIIQHNEPGREREREELQNKEAVIAIQHLGEWLRDQQLMEDTMVVMMQEGWMG